MVCYHCSFIFYTNSSHLFKDFKFNHNLKEIVMENLPNIFNNNAITFIAGESGSGKSVLLGCFLKRREKATVFSIDRYHETSSVYLCKEEGGLFTQYKPLDFFDTAKDSEILDVFKECYRFNDLIENSHLYNHNFFIDSFKHAFVVDTVLAAIKNRNERLFKNTYEFIDFILEKVSQHPELKFSELIPFLQSIKEIPDDRKDHIVFNGKVNSIHLSDQYPNNFSVRYVNSIVKNIAREIAEKRALGDNSKVIVCFDEMFAYLNDKNCDLLPLFMNNVNIVIVSQLFSDFVNVLTNIYRLNRLKTPKAINLISYRQPKSQVENSDSSFMHYLNSILFNRVIPLSSENTHIIHDNNNHFSKMFNDKIQCINRGINKIDIPREFLYMSIPEIINENTSPSVEIKSWSIDESDLQLLRSDVMGRTKRN